ncbi:MAG: hypothetical protein ACRC9R_02220 [Enterovibrio sp.]
MKNYFFLIFSLFLSGCYTEVVDSISNRESIKIESVLIENGIMPKTTRGQDGYTIKVKEGDRLKAISLLSYYGLPSQEVMDIEKLFPPGELVASPFAEKNRLIYGVSNNLRKTIETIPGVISASVDLAYLSDKTNKSDNKASVVIVYQLPLEVTAKFIEKVKAIVVNANPDIAYENVSVGTFKKEYIPITKDLVPSSNSSLEIYIYLFVFIIVFLIASLIAYGYGRDKKS